jgi:hypothetical protein
MPGVDKPQASQQPGRQAHVAGQRFGVLLAGTLVLLLSLVFIGMSHVSQLSTSTPAESSPPNKATVFAQYAATTAAQETQVPAATKGPYAPPPAMPTPTFTSEIFYYDGQDKFPDFKTNDAYRGQVNGTWEFVYVGSDTTHAAHGVGAVRVTTFSNAAGDRLVGIFDAPDGSTGLDITGINGARLRLTSDRTASFGFDLTTNTFSS